MRVQERREVWRVDRRPEAGDVGAEGVAARRLIAPEVELEVCTADDGWRLAHELFQDREAHVGEGEPPVAPEYLASGHAHPQVAHVEGLGWGTEPALGAPDHGPEPRHHLGQGEGFDQVVVRSRAEAAQPVLQRVGRS